ncbi:hypothetical protein GIB67_022582 [Kingdonia uniflora]|uniref:Helicase ATP-binding domain-containing protein n=1 Tax=Kingdonia uniflora TaxID=39325 RepID=A0A7J7L7N6_9MAGN|nr:hypothetical protein GIB67_022582 [Kingdonia uniflora]
MLEFEQANLISWARHLARRGKLQDLFDPALQSMDQDQALLCITVAFLYLQQSPVKRPSIKEVVGMLSGDSELPHLPVEFSPSPPSNLFKSRKKARAPGNWLNEDSETCSIGREDTRFLTQQQLDIYICNSWNLHLVFAVKLLNWCKWEPPDQVDTLIETAAAKWAIDGTNILRLALAGGEFQEDPALERRFQLVEVPEPTVDEAVQILKGLKEQYETHHMLHYAYGALVAAARLPFQYIRWDTTFNMVLHENTGVVRFNLYEWVSNNNNVAKLLEIALDDGMDKEPNVPLPCLEVSLLELLPAVPDGVELDCHSSCNLQDTRLFFLFCFLSQIDHIFLSRVCSETAGGLPGLLLTLAGMGDDFGWFGVKGADIATYNYRKGQVYAEFEVYGGSLNLTGCCLYGGAPYHSQETSLKRGVDIVIGTPGRIRRGNLNFSSLKFRVLDEADEMLKMGFVDDVELILGKVKDASVDQITVVFVEEQTIDVAQTEVVISHQEEDVGEASQSVYLWTKESKEKVEQNKKEVFEDKDNYDGNSQNKLDLKQVIDVYIKALIQYLDTQHRARPDKEKIVPADVFAGQYIYRAFNVWIRNMSSPKGKKKLSHGHQLIEDHISTILPKMLIWSDFFDRSSPPTGSEVYDYGLNFKWITRFEKCPIQPNGYDCGVYMFVFMDNLLRGMKFLDLIDGNEYRYTIVYDILRLGVEPEEILKL